MVSKRNDPWFKFYPDDWLEKTRHMTLEQRGAYIDAIALQMRDERPLRLDVVGEGDDAVNDYGWLAHKMHISKRKAKVIVESLIEEMALRQTGEGLVNDRCLEEIAERNEQRRAASEAAKKRERDKADERDQNPRTTAGSKSAQKQTSVEPTPTRPRTNADSTSNQSLNEAEKEKKSNEINVNMGRGLPEGEGYAHALPRATDREGEREEEKTLLTEGQKDASPGGSAAKPGKAKSSTRGTRLPSDWRLPAHWRQLSSATFEMNSLQIEREARQFRDYWIGKPGKDGRKIDWLATWRNWLRKSGYAEREMKPPAEQPWWKDPAKLRSLSEKQWRNSISKHANGIWPVDKLGPVPGTDECVVPDALVQELKLAKIYDRHGIKRKGY